MKSTYIFPACVLVAVAAYYIYGALNRMGLPTEQAEGRVTGKSFTPGSTTYNTTIAGGRAWTQPFQQPDHYAITLEVNGETAVGLVDPKTYESLQTNDRVRVQYQRTRFSKQLLVTEVRRV